MAKASKVERSQIKAASITAAATLLGDRLKDVHDPHESARLLIDFASAIYIVACDDDWSSKEPVGSDEPGD